MATVTTAALKAVSALVGASFKYVAVGIGTTAESAAHTQLVSETTTVGLERTTGTLTYEDTTHTDDTLQIVKTWTVTGAGATVTEVMIGDNASANTGTMLFRDKLTTARALIAGDTYTLTAQAIFVDA